MSNQVDLLVFYINRNVLESELLSSSWFFKFNSLLNHIASCLIEDRYLGIVHSNHVVRLN